MSKELILITGGNGMFAKELCKVLKMSYEVRFLSRKANKPNHYRWDISSGFIDERAFDGVQHIVHLAGASIGEKRWTKSRKQEILDSRVQSAEILLNALKKHRIRLKTFISASAVGYYGTKTTENIYTENSPKGNDFLSDVCQQWEAVADRFNILSDRVLKLRLGVIISKNGGILSKMLPITKIGLGAVLGNGKQYIPWIDIADLVNVTQFLLEEKNASGVFNIVAPEHIRNKNFTHSLATVVGRKIIFPPLPKYLIQCLFGEASVLLLQGSRIRAERLEKLGYDFQFKTLLASLKHNLS